MDLYKKENLSPFSGCLSSILQIILVISMFYLVSRPLTYMKHVEPEVIDQYAQELRETEGNTNYQEIGIIRTKSAEDERVNINMNFLGLNLSAVPSQNYNDWKVFIIPVLYVATSFISTRITAKMNSPKKKEEKNANANSTELVKKEEDDIDMMAEMNKNMTMMMPIMTVSIALIAPLGLALYWLINNIFMLGERLILNKYFKSEED